MSDIFYQAMRAIADARAAQQERVVRSLLERWVSGLTPALALDRRGEILGLCEADSPVGSAPFILRVQS